MTPIHLRNIPPPDETFDHPAFFKFLFSYLKPENYLELGVRDGRNLFVVGKYCKKITAVDVIPQSFSRDSVGSESFVYHQTTTDLFFSSLDKEALFDAIFIDADHSHQQTLKDFLNAKDHLIEDGFIFFHDTYPYDSWMCVKNGCDDAYRTPLFIKEHLIDEFEVLTLPFSPGVTQIGRAHV